MARCHRTAGLDQLGSTSSNVDGVDNKRFARRFRRNAVPHVTTLRQLIALSNGRARKKKITLPEKA